MPKHFVVLGSFISCLALTGCSTLTTVPAAAADQPALSSQTTRPESHKPNLLYTQRWVATEIDGFQVQVPEQNIAQTPFIQFDARTKRFSGSDGCNRIMGSFSNSADSLTLEQTTTTKIMCPNANNLTATQYIQALEKTDHYRVSSQLLVLFDQNGQTLIAFKKAS